MGLDTHASWTLLVGVAVVAAGLIRSGCTRLHVPPLVGYLVLGILLSLLNTRWAIVDEPVHHAFDLLADLGVIALLFQVGLNSHPEALARKLPDALPVWGGNVLGAAVLGFAASYYLLQLSLVTALVVATALTATSVGVSVAAWQDARALDSPGGHLLLDVAELDDVSAIMLMTLLFAIVPVLQGESAFAWTALAIAGGSMIAKLGLFISACYLFSRYLERRLVGLTERLEAAPEFMLTIAGLGFLIAAFAAGLGFSLAIGALFAGLLFSRDPEAVKTQDSFRILYAFVTPFFFINIGLSIDPAHLAAGLETGAVLVAAAVAGKMLGAGLPALLTTGTAGAALIGISMIPRAEIAMIVIHQGQALGPDIVPDSVYAGMVFVAAVTCVGASIGVGAMLHRWPDAREHSR